MGPCLRSRMGLTRRIQQNEGHPHSAGLIPLRPSKFGYSLINLVTSMLVFSLRALTMQVLTNFRPASQLTVLPLASALHATVACFRATFSALDIFAATGVDPAIPATR